VDERALLKDIFIRFAKSEFYNEKNYLFMRFEQSLVCKGDDGNDDDNAKEERKTGMEDEPGLHKSNLIYIN